MTAAAERRRADLRDHKRKRILAAARRVCDAGGPDALTVRAVAAEASYTPGAVYSYFDNIDTLAIALVAEEFGHLARWMKEAAAAATDPPGRLQATARAALTAFAQNAPHVRLAGRLMSDNGHALPPELERALTGRLITVLEALGVPLREATGLEGEAAHAETLSFAAFLIGLEVLGASGRLKPLGFKTETLLARELARRLG